MSVSPWELLVVALVVALLFGSRFAQVGKAIGEGVRNFKRALAGEDGDDREPR